MNPAMEESLTHYGMPKRSGRYPWGSGDDPYQHGSRDILGRIDELKKQGKTEREIAAELGLFDEKGNPSTGKLRTVRSVANDERRLHQIATMKAMREDGKGYTEIGREMGLSESTVRSMLDPKVEARAVQAKNTADFIRDQIESKGMIDVGVGVERELNISKEKLKEALYILEEEGYPVYKGGIPQPTNPGQQTNQKVICPKGTEHKEIYNYDQIHALNEDNYISRDGGDTFEKRFTYPASMDSSRLQIRYKEDGGIDKDGIVELRRNVDDLSLGESRYSQVRILVDGTHYIKGVAVYSDNMPDGVDVVFNTNKSKNVPMKDVLKKIKDDPDNPFGSAIKDAEQGGQYWYDPKTGKRVSSKDPNAKLGLINKRADEGDWTDWQDALPSQFLGKQNLPMIKKQLNLAKSDKMAEFDEICALNNPTVKKHYLEEFASQCDAAAVHLKAAALPGQKYHVIVPVNTLKDTEVYAPRYEDGTKLALVRYPHGGTFEIPILTVNNKHAAAKKLLGSDPSDAVGITSKVAERLSGADFDGDTVMCIPTHDPKGRVKITNKDPLPGLEGFDPKMSYGPETYKGKKIKLMTNTNTQMGIISNLITDMTLAGANDDELARAVRHSMVVIDAEKHKLDYRKSEIDNNISALKKKYQPKYDDDGNVVGGGGASTILSRAKGVEKVTKRQGTPHVNIKGSKWYDPSRPEGALIYKDADDATYTKTKTNKRTGETITITKTRTQDSTRMAETDDARTLVSSFRDPKELAYADYANSMKSLANKARLEIAKTGNIKYSATAAKTYANEVASLNTKTNTALMNAARERHASRKANAEVAAKKSVNPDMSKKDIKKASQQALTKARDEVGSVSRKKRSIKITDREWEAIQAGAISENKLKQILNNADADELRQRATPRSSTALSVAKVNKIKQMSNSNYSLAEIAKACNCSTSAVSKYLKGA